MSRSVVFDACILIDQLRTNKRTAQILALHGNVRNCSVVLAELWRGAKTRTDVKVLNALQKNHPIFTPSESNWLESGAILANMHRDLGFTPPKLRDLHFDVLIALTVRSFGATLITSNRSDFELIRNYRHFELELW